MNVTAIDSSLIGNEHDTEIDSSFVAGDGAVWSWPARNGVQGIVALFLLVAGLYVFGSAIALQMIDLFALDGVFFIPAGVTVAFLLRLPKKMWWIVLGAAGLAEFLMDTAVGFSSIEAAGFALANVAEPLAGAAIVVATCGAVDLARRSHVVWYTVGAVILAPALGGTIIAVTSGLLGDGGFWATFGQVWLGDALAVVVVGGAILVWGSSRDRRSVFSFWGVGLLLGTAALTGGVLTLTGRPLAFAGLIGIALAGALLGVRAVALTSLAVVLALAVALALDPAGMLTGLKEGETLVLIKLQVLVFSVAGLVIAAEAHEREFAFERAARSSLEAQVAERAREREREIAIRVQRSLLPDHVVERPDIEISAAYESAGSTYEAGGDWYDSFELPDGRIGLVVGDIVGHGIDALTSMGRLRTALGALAMRGNTPSTLLRDLDVFVGGPDGTAYATAFYAIVDVDAGTLEYSSAGHPPGLIVRMSGETEWLDAGLSGPLFGDPIPRRHANAAIRAGDAIILYSDGLIERRGQSLTEGLSRLEEAAARLGTDDPARLCRELISEFDPGDSRSDDIVVMVFKVRTTPIQLYRQSFSARADQLREIRRSARDWLDEQGVDDAVAEDVILGLGEATTNVVRHAYPDNTGRLIDVRMRHGDSRLVVEVEDRGRWKEEDGQSPTGHGLRILRDISDTFELDRNVLGTRVRFTFEGLRQSTSR